MGKHQHGEAFKLMNYACVCGHREVIWNSRDGVTPFGMGCPSCGNPSLRHVNWRDDVYAPDHKLFNGQRYWRDGTPDEAEAILRRRFERFSPTHPVDPETAEIMLAQAREGDERSGFRKGWPAISVYDAALSRKDPSQ
jgi:hypothetical protein